MNGRRYSSLLVAINCRPPFSTRARDQWFRPACVTVSQPSSSPSEQARRPPSSRRICGLGHSNARRSQPRNTMSHCRCWRAGMLARSAHAVEGASCSCVLHWLNGARAACRALVRFNADLPSPRDCRAVMCPSSLPIPRQLEPDVRHKHHLHRHGTGAGEADAEMQGEQKSNCSKGMWAVETRRDAERSTTLSVPVGAGLSSITKVRSWITNEEDGDGGAADDARVRGYRRNKDEPVISAFRERVLITGLSRVSTKPKREKQQETGTANNREPDKTSRPEAIIGLRGDLNASRHYHHVPTPPLPSSISRAGAASSDPVDSRVARAGRQHLKWPLQLARSSLCAARRGGACSPGPGRGVRAETDTLVQRAGPRLHAPDSTLR